MSPRLLDEERREWIAATISRLTADVLRDAWALGIEVTRGECGETIVDCGLHASGSWEAGRRLVEISQGGMASARVGCAPIGATLLPEMCVESWQPALSAYGFQASVPLVEVDAAIRISGPILARFPDARLSAGRTRRSESAAWGVAVVEAERLDGEIAAALAHRSGLPTDALTLFIVPNGSIAGASQLAGRINECVMFTLEESLSISADAVSHVLGAAPIAPTGPAASSAVGADDLLHYAGRAVLTLDSTGIDSLAALAHQLTFASTPLYGRRFAEVLQQAGGVFEAIPGLVHLNKVAQVTVIDARDGTTFSAGARDEARLGEWLRASRSEPEVGR